MSVIKKYCTKPIEVEVALVTRETEQEICELFESRDMPHLHGADDTSIIFALLPRAGTTVALMTGRYELIKAGEYIIFHGDDSVTVVGDEETLLREYEPVPSALTPEEQLLHDILEEPTP
jgi:hypothetical protein